jgi:putative acyl-CoA dehydrogenase
MDTQTPRHRKTDDVFNQPPPLEDYNLFEPDLPLREALRREGGGWIEDEALAYGALLGKAETLRLGERANRTPPELHSFDRFGHRIDEVEFHPAWHELMRLGIARGTHALPWSSSRSGAHAARAVLLMLKHQVDEGTSCPITMTCAAIPALRRQPELAQEWESRILSSEYDPRFVPAAEKRGALFGMAMTERQGGSDVRLNTTRARAVGSGGPGGEYAISGQKWFCSAPMSDAFLVLAQAPGGLSCYLLPRWKHDGSRNGFHILRLKDKLGNRSNASCEVEFADASARLIGEEGRGVAVIMEMVRHTRLDCALASAASLRRAVAEATHHAQYRFAFGRRLIEQPLMKNVLADLCLESEAATAMALRLARGFDEAPDSDERRKWVRIATALGKYWITKRAIAATAEALECIGGNGYVEESPMPRLYRDAPLNSLWEGAGNVQCLDVLRALNRDADAIAVVLAELQRAKGGCRHFDAYLERIEWELRDRDQLETRARQVVERLALVMQAALLIQHGPSEVAAAFCASRLAGNHGLELGTLPAGVAFSLIIERSRPKLKGD